MTALRATIKTPPPVNPGLAQLETELELVALEELGDNVFTNVRPLFQPEGARGIFGGCVIAQCLAAAQRTVEDGMKIHSMHCYFILAGNASVPVVYHVERVRSGRSFATRTVQARQRGRCIATTTCSFVRTLKKSDTKLEHSVPFPGDIPMPEDCPAKLQAPAWFKKGSADTNYEERFRQQMEKEPCEWRRLGVTDKSSDTVPTDKRSRQWVRVKGKIHDEDLHLPALAYFSDRYFLGTATRVNPVNPKDIGMVVSLDHTIYFHHAAEIRADEWMLMEMDSSWAGEERALVTQRIWNRDGVLVATCYQEGLIRLKSVMDETSKL